MFSNYLKIAWRSLLKNKSSSIINLVGLSAGLTCCLMMVLYIQHELSFDQFHTKGDRIARVIMQYRFNESELTSGNFTSTKVLPSFRKNFPEVLDGVRLSPLQRLVKYNDITFDEEGFLYSDSSFFQLFDFKLIQGDPKKVLNGINQIVLTQSTAKKYFGNENPIGKILKVGSGQDDFTVTGITEDCPANSQLVFTMIAPFTSLVKNPQEESYFEANYTTYLLLKDNKAIASMQQKMESFMKEELKEEKGVYINYILEPYTQVHLYSPYDAITPNSNIRYIYIIGAIALFVLMIACFTYVNLSTARSMERAREVGIRKVSGALKSQVFWQFITESVLISIFACILSIGLLALTIPYFNQLTEKHMEISEIFKPAILSVSILIIAIVSLLAGSYPALILAGFEPITVLKGAFKNTSSGAFLRKSLIVFQFVISLFLLTSTIVISKQLHYIQNKNLGYDRDHVVLTKIDQKIRDKMNLFKTELKTNSHILAVTMANFTPVNIPGGYVMYRGDQTSDQAINTRGNNIDEDYLKTNGLKLIAGSDLSHQDQLDANQDDYKKNYFHFIINETAAKKLGWSAEEAVGKKLFLGESRPGEIKGVVADFNFASLHSTIEPLVLFPSNWASIMMIKISGNDLTGTLAWLDDKWKVLAPHRPFEYHFMDEDFNKLYNSEIRTGKVITIFSGIAMLLACIGLFGLSSYSARQRLKELSIRKVLGASASSLFILLSDTFVRLVLIAFAIAVPISWISMNKWLSDFAYRIDLSWWMFGLTGLIAILITLFTISFQSLQAAFANPIESLRSE